ncbi:hypothetical protein C7U57_24150 [Pseudomonas sp. R9.37]|nr:hypothetical protein C7U57_24150 [Pseudomonas sp. R9.37]
MQPSCYAYVSTKRRGVILESLCVVIIGCTAKVQRCMIDRGFEPKNKIMLVCQTYSEMKGCSSTTPPS